jgi:hypothetical protein
MSSYDEEWYFCLMCARSHWRVATKGIAATHRQYADTSRSAFSINIPSTEALRRRWVREHYPEIQLAGKPRHGEVDK